MMSKKKDFLIKCGTKINMFKDKMRLNKRSDSDIQLPYDISQGTQNVMSVMQLCSELKRIGSFGLVTYSIVDCDKSLKKKSLQYLVSLFHDMNTKFNENDALRAPLLSAAKAINKISEFTELFQRNIETQIIGIFNDLEARCVEIQELNKRLHLLQKEKDVLQERLNRFYDQINPDEQKEQQMRDQIKKAESDLDGVKDLYLLKILQFEALNFPSSEALQDLLLLRAEYHSSCVLELKKVIPECKQAMEEKRLPLAFGTPLETHLEETKRTLAYPLQCCVDALNNLKDLRQEGLFRVSGTKLKADLLCEVLNVMKFEQVDCEWSPSVITDALKRYLSQMPTGLLGKLSLSDMDSCCQKFRKGQQREALWNLKDAILKLSKPYLHNLEYLIRFLTKVVEEQNYNHMNIENICTVFVPNLFCMSSNNRAEIEMDNNAVQRFTIEMLLTQTDFFFHHSNYHSIENFHIFFVASEKIKKLMSLIAWPVMTPILTIGNRQVDPKLGSSLFDRIINLLRRINWIERSTLWKQSEPLGFYENLDYFMRPVERHFWMHTLSDDERRLAIRNWMEPYKGAVLKAVQSSGLTEEEIQLDEMIKLPSHLNIHVVQGLFDAGPVILNLPMV